MNKVILAVNVLLAAAVIYLLVDNAGSSTGTETDTVTSTDSTSTTPVVDLNGTSTAMPTGSATIAWVNIDSVSNQYVEIADLSKVISDKEQRYQGRLEAMYKTWQEDGAEFQRKYQLGGWTELEAQEKSMELEKRAADIQRYEQEEGRKLQIESNNLQVQLMKTLGDFVEQYAADNGIDFVYGKSFGVNTFLYGDPARDITNDVVNGLNAQYEASKLEPVTPSANPAAAPSN